jgi:hypothetical protein
MPRHARDVEDWTATAQLHALIESSTPLQGQRAAARTRLRVLAQLAELKQATETPAIPRHSLSHVVSLPVIHRRIRR